jgi:thioredoxin reductase/Pyruvate/2-oxoacid:ferredoxin oxidoreductase delta subunit
MDTLVAFLISAAVIGFFLLLHVQKHKKREGEAREAAEHGKLRSDGPRAQHPQIDANYCIGCGACTTVCPEGDVLAMLGGKAMIVNGYKCIGHSLCVDACPVGAITMVMAKPGVSADLPYLTPEFETTIPNLFVVGELGGLALIRNAISQGRDCVHTIAGRVSLRGSTQKSADVFDLLIVGAGPAGISASLAAIQNKLHYITVDEGEIGGTVAKYPRQKLVLTSPVEFPMYGKFAKTELSKEDLLAFWNQLLQRNDFNFRQSHKVQDIRRDADGNFTITSSRQLFRARYVILALGKTGSPRKLGVKGENLPKVMYRLIEADHYVNKKILVVGGGDSAVEAAMGLAFQVGNTVTLSYRGAEFTRIKQRNAQRLEDSIRRKKLAVIFNSNPVEFLSDAVILDLGGSLQRITNDFVWIFAGGEPPTTFLKKIGVGLGSQDLTLQASNQPREDKHAKALGD